MGAKILAVDDSRTIRLIISKCFKAYDCELVEAGNGAEALAIAAKEKPDLIMLDLSMPVMDGYETLGRLKADPELRAIPVIMLTAEASRENVLKIAQLGVKDYIVKPFREQMIVERVGKVVALKRRNPIAARAKRFDDPLGILVVDDKPAIMEQIRAGLGDTPWTLQNRVQLADAVAYCNDNPVDVILISLSLPENGGFTLFQMLRGNPKTKQVPIFALCVKTASDDLVLAQEMGFSGVVTKPIDFEELKAKMARALSLDTSYRYFQHRDGVLAVTLPTAFGPNVANEVSLHLRTKVAEAVDAGMDKIVLDMSRLKSEPLLSR